MTIRRTLPKPVRYACAAVSLLLFGWMVVAFFNGPDFEYGKGAGDTPAFTARCEPLLWGWGVSWGGTPDASDLYASPHHGFTVIEGELPTSNSPTSGDAPADPEEAQGLRETVASEVDRYCDRARDGQSALVGIAAVPAAFLGAVAYAGRGRRED